MFIFAGKIFVYMIREKIFQQMMKRGVNQTTVCNDLCLQMSNFNAFLRGKRAMPFKDLVAVMKYLRVSVAPRGTESTATPPENMNEICSNRIKQGGLKLVEVEAASGINRTSISSFLTGKQVMSSKNLARLLQALGLDIVPFKKGE